MKCNKVAEILIKKLKKQGFIVHRQNSITTNSIYLKLDYGVARGIRIADHPGRKKYHYRYNVMKDYKGDKVTYFGNLVSYFYTFEELPELLQKVKEEKQEILSNIGERNYKLSMEANKTENPVFKRTKLMK